MRRIVSCASIAHLLATTNRAWAFPSDARPNGLGVGLDRRGPCSRRGGVVERGITSNSVGAATLAAVTDPMALRSVIESASAVSWRSVAYPQVTPWPVG